MTLKIERISGEPRAQIRLIGELRSENLSDLKIEIDRERPRLVLDLEELTLADIEAVRFLNACETEGIPVLHTPPYVRKWMIQERAEKKGARKPNEAEFGETGNIKGES